MVAAIRPDDWNLPLFLHVLGAMLLVGALVLVVATLLVGWRRAEGGDAAVLSRFGFRALLLGVLPAYVLMRVSAEWIYSKEFGESEEDPDWVGIGYITSDVGLVLLVLAIVVAGLAARRTRAGGGSALVRAAAVLAAILLAAYLVAMWAMTAKPGA